MTKLNVGDTVRLVGEGWDGLNINGQEVEITEVANPDHDHQWDGHFPDPRGGGDGVFYVYSEDTYSAKSWGYEIVAQTKRAVGSRSTLAVKVRNVGILLTALAEVGAIRQDDHDRLIDLLDEVSEEVANLG